MSTYYYFACTKCKEYGGLFSRQAWGWGNMEIVDSFAFLANHVAHCGEGNIRVISEHKTFDLECDEGWTHIISADDAEDGVGDHQRVADYALPAFPHSNDWERHEELFAAHQESSR